MSAERRYSEQEIAAIFEKAAEAQAARQHGHGEGLTLAELQQIGAESGLSPEYVAHAAAVVDRKLTMLPTHTYLGVPVGVARSMELPGAFSDQDWERLVADLRDTFQATGKTRNEGGLRTWRNGNLQAVVEPTDTGHRLRLRTRKGDAAGSLGLGLTAFVLGFIALLLVVVAGRDLAGMSGIWGMLLLMGAFMAGSQVLRLPRWAAERARQMEEVAARAAERSVQALPMPTIASPRLDLDALVGDETSTETNADRRRTRA